MEHRVRDDAAEARDDPRVKGRELDGKQAELHDGVSDEHGTQGRRIRVPANQKHDDAERDDDDAELTHPHGGSVIRQRHPLTVEQQLGAGEGEEPDGKREGGTQREKRGARQHRVEGARARPSEAMALLLCNALDVPLRAQNEALRAAGFEPRFPEPALTEIPPAIDGAIARMLETHEPYPLTVISPEADVLRSNRAASTLFPLFVADPTALEEPLNMFALVFDPRLMRPFIANWPAVARQMLARLQRESLQRGSDERLVALTQRVLAYPEVPAPWHAPDFTETVEPVFTVRFRRGELALAFFTTITTFSAPSTVTLDELRIESSYPLDDATRRFCAERASKTPGASS